MLIPHEGPGHVIRYITRATFSIAWHYYSIPLPGEQQGFIGDAVSNYRMNLDIKEPVGMKSP